MTAEKDRLEQSVNGSEVPEPTRHVKVDFTCQVTGTVEFNVPERDFDGIDTSEPFDLCEFIEMVVGTDGGLLGRVIDVCLPVNMDRRDHSTTVERAVFVAEPDVDVTECPGCGRKGTYDGRVMVDGRGIYRCTCGEVWQDAREKPSNKGVRIND